MGSYSAKRHMVKYFQELGKLVGVTGGIIFLRIGTRKYDGTWKRSETRAAELDNANSTFLSGRCNPEPRKSYWRNLVSQWYDGLPEVSDLGNASWKIPGLIGISKLES